MYKVPAHPDVVLIHYSGNDQIAENFPHGNSVKLVNFLPTATSLGARLADKSVKLADLQAQTVCKDIQFQPRNANQKRYFERKQSLNCDSFFVLHELAYMLPGLIWYIGTYPDLLVLFGLPDFLQMLDKCDNNKIFFTYDTTFNLGDFYLTALVVHLFDFVYCVDFCISAYICHVCLLISVLLAAFSILC